ncbi:MAG: peptidase S8, partial [Bacteroidetes bacterium]|nr:peptidase S8 [Bacteroidota bacterium]
MNKLSLIILCIVVCYSATFGQKDNLKNWHHKDPKKDKFQGISSNKAYQELLKGRPSKTVIVAIIDSGTDTTHEDLKGKFWVNKDEIPNNGIDD